MDDITNKRQNREKRKAVPVIVEDIHEPESEDEEKSMPQDRKGNKNRCCKKAAEKRN